MSALLWRIVIAAVCVLIIINILPPFFELIGFMGSGALMRIIQIAIIGIAVLYVLKGDKPIP